MTVPQIRLLSLGAGVQSTTLALMVAAGEFADPVDGAIFADTKWEPAEVYRHLDWLEPLLPFPVYRVSAGDLLADILRRRNTGGGRFASVPWFVRNPDGSPGMGRRQCTSEYKLKPIMHKTRELLGAGRRGRVPAGAVEVWVGISADEASRMKPARQRYIVNRWPLVERHMTRGDCLAWMAKRGYPTPPKSACIGCPFHNAAAWRRMRDERPADFAHAVEVDAALRQGDNDRGLRGAEYMHAARVPLAEAVELANQPSDNLNLFENECEGMCGV
jgi:hypothetical protein